MRVYVASQQDTLATIAREHHIPLSQLTSLNRQIHNPDEPIAGMHITLPDSSAPIHDQPPPLSYCPLESPPFQDDWIPLTPLEQMANTDYDVIIVGTGAGGGAVLWRLCQQWQNNGKKIGVVEAGDLLLQTNVQNVPTMNNERAAEYFLNPRISFPIGRFLPEYPGAKEVFALGGRTLFWNAVTPRLREEVFEQWPIASSELDVYYSLAERVMSVSQGYAKHSTLTEYQLNRLWAGGLHEATYMPLAADLQPTMYGEIHSNVFFSSIQLLGRALNLRSYDLAVKARAVEVMTEQNNVRAIKVMTPDKTSYELKAKTIVLAASTFETPRILLNSDIPGQAIGHYLTNHSFLISTGTLMTRTIPEVQGALGILLPQQRHKPYQIQIFGPSQFFWYHYQDKPSRELWQYGMAAFGVVQSRYENQLYLDPCQLDAFGVPRLNVRFAYNEADQVIIQRMLQAVQQIHTIVGPNPNHQQSLEHTCLQLPGRDYHEFGTCRMGHNPHTSATNPYGQIHHVSGLFVADNSVLPATGATNPTLTTVAVALRTADYINEQLQ